MSQKSISPESLLFANKPTGVPSHRVEQTAQGFVEWLIQKESKKIFICHRLDKETSGAMVFATDKEAAAKLTELFSARQIKKTYVFLSHKKASKDSWVHKSQIEKKEGGRWVSSSGDTAETKFEYIGGEDGSYMYKAYPLTGRTHQIRLHAQDSGTPVLGDNLYGGKIFPRLMLQSQKLEFDWYGELVSYESPLSLGFKDLSLCKDPQLFSWISSVERRQLLYKEALDDKSALRLVHSESGDLRVDKAGNTYLLGWWKQSAPSSQEVEKIKKFVAVMGFKNWSFHFRPPKNQKSELDLLLSSKNIDEAWEFQEGICNYQGALKRGHNFGLFLDQRERRHWVYKKSEGKSVLNLFAFTCGFSLNAALGGASKVVSVDLSKKYLEWGKENFTLNSLEPTDPKYEFRAIDSLDYLSYAKKKNLQFDIIVCDPPSFSRNKKKIFRLEKNYYELIEACRSVLTPGGVLLFSNNYEQWDFESWRERLDSEKNSLGFKELEVSYSQWDFEYQWRQANLKAFFLC